MHQEIGGLGQLQMCSGFNWNSQVIREVPIHVKELISIVIGAFVWGHQWAHEVVQFECDNWQ